MNRRIVFADLDGTLLDLRTYDCEISLPAVQALQKHDIPVVLCSAKTRLEVQLYRRKLGISDPFIVENGGAIIIPAGYFPFTVKANRRAEGYLFIEYGVGIETVKLKLEKALTSAGVGYKLFTQMRAEEIAEDSGLPLEEAELARRREYTETVKLEGGQKTLQKALRAILSSGLNCTFGGRYLTVNGGHSKGTAVRGLRELYSSGFGSITTYAFGDEENDLSMFQEVDKPILVQKPDRGWAEICVPGLVKVSGIGPRGFRKGVERVLCIHCGEV